MTGSAAIRSGVAFGVFGFGFGFMFGVVRTLLVAPRIGAFAAVAAEVPLMLAACTPLARWCLRRWAIAAPKTASAMGLVAFATGMACEVVFGLSLGQTPQMMLEAIARPAGMLGLAGQIGFALLPLGLLAAQRLPRE